MKVTVTYYLTEDNYTLLQRYGYDFEKNAQCQANEVAETLRWCQSNPDVDSDLAE